MALWDRLKTELDRAGRAAQTAFDEGKTRLDLTRVRQLADKAAQALGYAVHAARKEGRELDADSYERLSSALAAHEAEIHRLELELERENTAEVASAGAPQTDPGEPAATAPAEPIHDVDPAMGDNPDQASGARP